MEQSWSTCQASVSCIWKARARPLPSVKVNSACRGLNAQLHQHHAPPRPHTVYPSPSCHIFAKCIIVYRVLPTLSYSPTLLEAHSWRRTFRAPCQQPSPCHREHERCIFNRRLGSKHSSASNVGEEFACNYLQTTLKEEKRTERVDRSSGPVRIRPFAPSASPIRPKSASKNA